MLAQVRLLNCIWEVTALNLGCGTDRSWFLSVPPDKYCDSIKSWATAVSFHVVFNSLFIGLSSDAVRVYCELLTASSNEPQYRKYVDMKSTVIWDAMLRSSIVHRRFGRTYCCNFQGRRVIQARNQLYKIEIKQNRNRLRA
jgi:hypothetical protein